MNEITDKNGRQLVGKLIVLGILIIVSWVATLFVWNVIQDRENRQETASNEVAEQWSRSQIIAGPVLTVPVEKTTVTTTGELVVTSDTLVLLPRDLAYLCDIESELRTRGVYETPVYTATIKGSGVFDITDIGIETTANTKILWDKAVVSVTVSDTRGITSAVELTWKNTSHPFIPSSSFFALDGNGVHADVLVTSDQNEYPFSFTIPLKGSREISFLPLGLNTTVTLNSNWNTPSFQGQFLPEERNITANGFNANWKVTSFGRGVPQYWLQNGSVVNSEALLSTSFGVGLYQEVNFYTMIDRATKYSILFISLTFLTFFMYEVLAGLRIHPMQYLLVGLAIALFYLLLLSFAEIIGFMPAYFFSTVAITLLITGYCISVLKVKRRAFSITALLIALYSYLYILLQLDEFSLLFGSILLFGVLTTVMYLTRNLDWYTLKKPG
jgi:inner membrane protein